MELAKDCLRLSETVAQVPGLSIACALAMQIMKSVEMSKSNTTRLQYIAHFITVQLVGIAEHLRGRWDDASPKLKEHLDDLETILRDVAKTVKKYSRSWFTSLIIAGDLEKYITKLEKLLGDHQKTIILLIGVDISIGVNQIKTSVNAHRLLGLEMDSHLRQVGTGVLRLEKAVDKLTMAPRGFIHSDDAGFDTYTKDDIQLNLRIARRSRTADGSKLVVTLYQAERCIDGRVVLVKSYEGSQALTRQRVADEELRTCKDKWDPSILQLIGSSRPEGAITFHVYHCPNGHFEMFQGWLRRTLNSNPAETIYGLFDMQASIRDLLDFQQDQYVSTDSYLFSESIVKTESRGNGLTYRLVYAGSLSNRRPRIPTDSTALRCMLMNSVPKFYSAEELPGEVTAFCRASKIWIQDPRSLDSIANRGRATGAATHMSLPTIASALMVNGWLGTCSERVVAKTDIGLGDVGYIDEAGIFVIVANLHAQLTSTNGGFPTWKCTRSCSPGECAHDPMVVQRSDKAWKRSHVHEAGPYQWLREYIALGYDDLDERQAWKALQHWAWDTLACHSIAPHQLRLVTFVSTSFFVNVWSDQSVTAAGGVWEADPPRAMSTHNSGASDLHHQASTNGVIPPDFFIFEDNFGAHGRDSGIPELVMRMRASFEPEPDWLDNDETRHETGGFETKDGSRMEYGTLAPQIEYFQLPVGVTPPSAYLADISKPEYLCKL